MRFIDGKMDQNPVIPFQIYIHKSVTLESLVEKQHQSRVEFSPEKIPSSFQEESALICSSRSLNITNNRQTAH